MLNHRQDALRKRQILFAKTEKAGHVFQVCKAFHAQLKAYVALDPTRSFQLFAISVFYSFQVSREHYGVASCIASRQRICSVRRYLRNSLSYHIYSVCRWSLRFSENKKGLPWGRRFGDSASAGQTSGLEFTKRPTKLTVLSWLFTLRWLLFSCVRSDTEALGVQNQLTSHTKLFITEVSVITFIS